MTTKKISLRVFKVTCGDAKNGKPIVEAVKDRLAELSSADARRMPINLDSPQKKEDLIANYWDRSGSTAALCCSIVRVAIGNDVKHITKKLFEQRTFSINDLKNTKIEGAEALYEFDYYFGIGNGYLITNLPGRMTVTSLQTYLNWLLRPLSYEITPVIRENVQTELSDVESITFIDKDKFQASGGGELSLCEFAWDAIKGILVDGENLKDIDADELVSAKLIVKLKRSRKTSAERNQSFYGALIKPVADLENITLTTRSGGTISGDKIQYVEKVDVEVEDGEFLHEEQLFQCMDKLIQKVEALS